MLKITLKSNRSTYCELQARIICRELAQYCTSFDSFTVAFINDINKLKRINTSSCADWYKILQNKDVLELWHLNAQAEPDRLVLIVNDDGIAAISNW
jgi:hypothetical protein